MDNYKKKIAGQDYSGGQIPWNLFVGSKSYQKVLELGCGTGKSAIKLAEKYQTVFVSDQSFYNLSKLKQKIRNYSLFNIHCFCWGNSHEIPFKNDMFDLVFLNGDVSRSLDNLSLSEILRVLKTGGTLYFSTQNALRYKQLLFFKKNKRIPNLFEYKRALKNAGFSKTSYISLSPDIVQIREVQTFGNSSFQGRNFFQIFRGFKELKNFLKELKIVREFTAPGFGVFSKKGNRLQTTIEDIIEQITTWSNIDSWEITAPVFQVTQKGSFVFKVKNRKTDQGMIVKISLNNVAHKQLEQNFSQISLLYKRHTISQSLKEILPEPLIEQTCNKYSYFVEELKGGKTATLFCDSPELFNKILKNSVKKIILLHSETKVCGGEARSNLNNIVNNKIAQLHLVLTDTERENIIKLGAYLEKELLSQSLPAVFHKGDCSANNILVSKTYSISAFIDWDNSLEYGYPMLDLINLIESFKRHSKKLGMGEILKTYLLPMNLSALEKEMFSLYCMKMGISEKVIFPMCVLYWIEHITAQDLRHDEKWMENNVFGVWRYLKSTLSL